MKDHLDKGNNKINVVLISLLIIDFTEVASKGRCCKNHPALGRCLPSHDEDPNTSGKCWSYCNLECIGVRSAPHRRCLSPLFPLISFSLSSTGDTNPKRKLTPLPLAQSQKPFP
ncbi:Defensin-like protein 20-28 - like 5 [Theobroma cacao]|nr:Defensin-like protein 20-28 - like 5 [Theobroma cacao]